jgi:hypothetical protein
LTHDFQRSCALVGMAEMEDEDEGVLKLADALEEG